MAYEQIQGQNNQSLNLEFQDFPSNAKIKCKVTVTGVDEENNPTQVSLESQPIEIQ